jgi:hypothetical protein
MSPTFPAFGFRQDVGRYATPGLEKFDQFDFAEDFAVCSQWDLKYGSRNGMVLVDANLRCWRVVRVRRLGIRPPLWSYLLRLLFQQALYQVDVELEPLEPITLDQLRDRMTASILPNLTTFVTTKPSLERRDRLRTNRNCWMRSSPESAPQTLSRGSRISSTAVEEDASLG